jgi:hypothetical protein
MVEKEIIATKYTLSILKIGLKSLKSMKKGKNFRMRKSHAE